MSGRELSAFLAARLSAVRRAVWEAARQAGRSPQEVTLVAVSKQHPLEAVVTLAEAGQVDFGENRVQEALPKIEAAPLSLRWHLIGSLQRNKVKQAVGRFGLIHSLDRPALAEALARACAGQGLRQEVLIQVNVTGEASKHGVAPADLAPLCLQLSHLPELVPRGLMTMAPVVADPEEARPVFRALAQLREQVQAAHPDWRFDQLSMGMSADFGVAIGEGATLVRVGSAIFGARGGRNSSAQRETDPGCQG